jgi:polar amino acid transport system substrate-binding protein
MSKIMKRVITTLLAGLIGIVLRSAEPLKFAIGEWEPFTGQNMEGSGLISEIVTAACNAVDIKAEYEFVPWKRAESYVETGVCFATFPYMNIQERVGKFYFSDILYTSSMGILAHQGNARTANFTYSSPEDLKSFNLGIVVGSDAIKFPLERAGCRPIELRNADLNLKNLESDRLDFAIDDKTVLGYSNKKAYGSDSDKTNKFQFVKNVFIAISDYRLMVSVKYPNSQGILKKFNLGLKKIKTSGDYQTILMKYGM